MRFLLWAEALSSAAGSFQRVQKILCKINYGVVGVILRSSTISFSPGEPLPVWPVVRGRSCHFPFVLASPPRCPNLRVLRYSSSSPPPTSLHSFPIAAHNLFASPNLLIHDSLFRRIHLLLLPLRHEANSIACLCGQGCFRGLRPCGPYR